MTYYKILTCLFVFAANILVLTLGEVIIINIFLSAILLCYFIYAQKYVIGILIQLIIFPEYLPGKELSTSPFDVALISILIFFIIIVVTEFKHITLSKSGLTISFLLVVVCIIHLFAQPVTVDFRRDFIFFALTAFYLIFIVHSSTESISLSDVNNIAISLLVSMLTLFALGEGESRYGSNIIFYGHQYALLFAMALYMNRINGGHKTIIILLTLLVLNIQNFQSAHYLLFLLSLLLGNERQNSWKYFRLFLSIPIILILFNEIQSVVPSGTWLALKIGQVNAVLTLNIGSFNSLLIRYNEALALYYYVTNMELFFGQGLGAVYTTDFSSWRMLNLHAATFPIAQIDSGQFSYLHETILMYQKWFGIFGSSLLLLFLINSKPMFMVVAILLLFCGSIQAAISLMLFSVIRGVGSVRN